MELVFKAGILQFKIFFHRLHKWLPAKLPLHSSNQNAIEERRIRTFNFNYGDPNHSMAFTISMLLALRRPPRLFSISRHLPEHSLAI